MNRVQLLIEQARIQPDEARETAALLAGLSDAAFAHHVDYLERTVSKQEKGKVTAAVPSKPAAEAATATAGVRAEVSEFVGGLLDAANDGDPIGPRARGNVHDDDVDGVAGDIVSYFVSLDSADE